MNRNSYPSRPPWLITLTQFIVDLNLRKSWRLVVKRLSPRSDAVVFLGDMMDGGRDNMSDEEYEAYYTRFRDIFKPCSSPSPTYYIPGNHDTGLGVSAYFSPHADARYIAHFAHQQWNNNGLNYQISMADHTIVFIDALGLVEEDRERERLGRRYGDRAWKPLPGGTVEFLNKFSSRAYFSVSSVPENVKSRQTGDHREPIILMTHIPLARPYDASCGPLREKGTIREGAGHGYENTLSEEASRFLLSSLKPVSIFSGDDHDYCTLEHSIPNTQLQVSEVTVKSFSMVMNVQRPGFQLLSLVAPSPSTNQPAQHLHTPCLLPDQIGIYLSVYVPLVVLSLFGILVANVYRILYGSGRGDQGDRRAGVYSRGAKPRPRSGIPELGSTDEPLMMLDRTREGSDMRARGENDESRGLRAEDASNRTHAKKISAQFLPAPAAQSPLRQRHSALSWTTSHLWLFAENGAPVERGLIWGCMRDVSVVAWPPLGVFAGIAWWMFHS
ncbi:hypothetical protein HWV62_22969 [Athelia sp. TMB]|nr:hypothetical protein HWV62_22969 [Athelia sp. TMB]